MNETLSKIKAKADGVRASVAEEKDSSLETAQRLHQAALPLLKAFADIQENFVKIEALKRIWPSDYERRPDRARGLVIAIHGSET